MKPIHRRSARPARRAYCGRLLKGVRALTPTEMAALLELEPTARTCRSCDQAAPERARLELLIQTRDTPQDHNGDMPDAPGRP